MIIMYTLFAIVGYTFFFANLLLAISPGRSKSFAGMLWDSVLIAFNLMLGIWGTVGLIHNFGVIDKIFS